MFFKFRRFGCVQFSQNITFSQVASRGRLMVHANPFSYGNAEVRVLIVTEMLNRHRQSRASGERIRALGRPLTETVLRAMEQDPKIIAVHLTDAADFVLLPVPQGKSDRKEICRSFPGSVPKNLAHGALPLLVHQTPPQGWDPAPGGSNPCSGIGRRGAKPHDNVRITTLLAKTA